MASTANIWDEILEIGRQEMQCLCDEQEDEAINLAQRRMDLLTTAMLGAERSPEVMSRLVAVQKQQRELELKARRSKEEIAETLRGSKKQSQCMAGYHSAARNVTGYNTYLNMKG